MSFRNYRVGKKFYRVTIPAVYYSYFIPPGKKSRRTIVPESEEKIKGIKFSFVKRLLSA
jgi:hypothetical protein